MAVVFDTCPGAQTGFPGNSQQAAPHRRHLLQCVFCGDVKGFVTNLSPSETKGQCHEAVMADAVSADRGLVPDAVLVGEGAMPGSHTPPFPPLGAEKKDAETLCKPGEVQKHPEHFPQ